MPVTVHLLRPVHADDSCPSFLHFAPMGQHEILTEELVICGLCQPCTFATGKIPCTIPLYGIVTFRVCS